VLLWHAFKLAVGGAIILGLAAALVYGAFFAKEDDVQKVKHQRMPVVGDCLNANEDARLITDCGSGDAALKVIASFGGGESAQCNGVPGVTESFVYKESIKVGGAEGFDVTDPAYTTLCVGPVQ
jgi:hypothetical protein